MLPEVFHALVKLGYDFTRHRHFRRVRLKIVPQFRNEEDLFGRGKSQNFGKLLKNHEAIIAVRGGFGKRRPHRQPGSRDAYRTATAEELARRFELSVPAWTGRETRQLHQPWFATPLGAVRAVLLYPKARLYRDPNHPALEGGGIMMRGFRSRDPGR